VHVHAVVLSATAVCFDLSDPPSPPLQAAVASAKVTATTLAAPSQCFDPCAGRQRTFAACLIIIDSSMAMDAFAVAGACPMRALSNSRFAA
jgi:hypothetical protein